MFLKIAQCPEGVHAVAMIVLHTWLDKDVALRTLPDGWKLVGQRRSKEFEIVVRDESWYHDSSLVQPVGQVARDPVGQTSFEMNLVTK